MGRELYCKTDCDPGCSIVTLGAVRVSRRHVHSSLNPRASCTGPGAYLMAATEDASLKEERGWGELGRRCIPVGFFGGGQCRHGVGSREWPLSLTLRWDLCQMQDGRAVSVSPAKWTGSRSFAEIMRGARSSFLSLKGFSRPSCRMRRESLGAWLFYRTSLLLAVTLPRI